MACTSSCRSRRAAWPLSSASAGSNRWESTCPNCSRAAADPSAARWSCADEAYLARREGNTMTETMTGLLKLSREYGAHNYHPLPVVAAEAEGAWVSDVEGRRYL